MSKKEMAELIQALQKTIESQNQTIANLNETLEQFKRMIFGASSEKTSQEEKERIEGQLNLFNEVEELVDETLEEPSFEEVVSVSEESTPQQSRKLKSKQSDLIGDLIPVRQVPFAEQDGDNLCDYCGNEMTVLTTEVVRRELNVIPAQVEVIEYTRNVYVCNTCKKDGDTSIKRPAVPDALLPHSLASPSMVAYIMYQKYVNAMPLYRQEKDWAQLGIKLNRATMANWVNTCGIDYLSLLYDLLHEELLKREILMVDETPCQILKEEGREAKQKSYFWVYRTGKDELPPIILYEYQPGRKSCFPQAFLKDYEEYLQTDGYSGYNRLPNVTRVGCFAHLRRKWYEAMPKRNPNDNLTHAEIGYGYCNKLFEIERELADLAPEERRKQRLERLTPVLRAFWAWVNTLNPSRGSKLNKAVTYALNQKPYLDNILLDGRLSLSTNLVENSIRPFTIGRKNFLFFDTPKGAKAGQIIYSLVETAKANNINVLSYLQLLLQNVPGHKNGSEGIEYLLPWSDYIRKNCKVLI